MEIFLSVLLFLVTVAMISVILVQKSDGQGLASMAGGSSRNWMSAKSAANILTRTTAILAALFFGLCLILATIASRSHQSKQSLFAEVNTGGQDIEDSLLPQPLKVVSEETNVTPEEMVPLGDPTISGAIANAEAAAEAEKIVGKK